MILFEAKSDISYIELFEKHLTGFFKCFAPLFPLKLLIIMQKDDSEEKRIKKEEKSGSFEVKKEKDTFSEPGKNLPRRICVESFLILKNL